ncbi:MAG: S49 family peptidase [Microbacteriaceae bacterium]
MTQIQKTRPSREALALIDRRYSASWLDELFDFSAVQVEKHADQVTVRIKYSLFPEDHRDIANAMSQAFSDAEQTTGKRVVVIASSPGGSVEGCFEACHDVEEARAQHPDITVTVFTQGLLASAMYAHACSMTIMGNDEIVITPAGEAGSVGVVVPQWDETAALEQLGIKITYFAYPQGKADGRLGTSLSEAGAKKLQTDVESIYAMFAAVVSASRGLTVEQITALNADTFLGNEALSLGLVDRVVESASVLFIDQSGEDLPEPPPDPEDPEEKIQGVSTNRVITAEDTMAEIPTTNSQTAEATQPSREAELSALVAQLQSEKAKLEVEAVLATRADLTADQKTFLSGKSKAEVEGFLAVLPLPKPEPKTDEKSDKPKGSVVAVAATAAQPAGLLPFTADDSQLQAHQLNNLNRYMPKREPSAAAKARASFDEETSKLVIR